MKQNVQNVVCKARLLFLRGRILDEEVGGDGEDNKRGRNQSLLLPKLRCDSGKCKPPKQVQEQEPVGRI